MAKKIQVEAFYGAHYHAGCMVCEFAAGIRTAETPTAQDVRKAVKKHVRETGHECWVESGTSWHYSLLSNDDESGNAHQAYSRVPFATGSPAEGRKPHARGKSRRDGKDPS